MTTKEMAFSSPKVSYALDTHRQHFIQEDNAKKRSSEISGEYHFRIERISLTAAIPLFAINILLMTVCPPF
jgi:hypothetical protein